MYTFILLISSLVYTRALPIVQPGLFVISGVLTCGNGSGYCLLGSDCTVNNDFVADTTGNCHGLRTAFTPEAFFSCCRYVMKTSSFNIEDTTLSMTPTTPSFVTEIMPDVTDDIIDLNGISGTEQNDGQIVISNEIDGRDEYLSGRLNDVGRLTIPRERLLDINHLDCDSSIKQEHATMPSLLLPNTVRFDNNSPENEINGMKPRQLEAEIFEDIKSSTPHNEGGIDLHQSTLVPVSNSERNCTRHAFAEMLPVASNSEIFGSNIIKKERLDQMNKPKCLELTEFTENAKRCVEIWKFISNDQTLCFGSLIESTWLLTSAACVIQIYDAGMDSIIVTDIKETSGIYGISNMIVHENYKIEQLEDLNNIGLISLNRHANSSCYVCLPRENRQYADKPCITYSTSVESRTNVLDKCQDRLKILSMHSRNYLSLPCLSLSDEQHFSVMENKSARALWCENTLVGIQTAYGEGTFVFTPIVEYTDWIQKNIRMYVSGVTEKSIDLKS